MSLHGLQIRAATGTEAPELAVLLGGAGIAVEPRALAERLGALREAPGAVLVAWEWGPPSGVIALHWYAALQVARPVARVTLLLVDPEARRRGVGRVLLKAAAQAARRAGCGDIELLADEPSLAAFCQATGFTEEAGRWVRSLRKQG
jgi:GNAT superfamily N-acetyltransferase